MSTGSALPLPAGTYLHSSHPTLIWTRFGPGEDPLHSIAAIAKKHGADSGTIVSCMGSLALAGYMIAVPDPVNGWRYSEPRFAEGPVELVSSQGTWGLDEATGELIVHLHAIMINSEGRAFGGHLIPGASRVLATCEVGMLTGPGIIIRRQYDPAVGVALLAPAPGAGA